MVLYAEEEVSLHNMDHSTQQRVVSIGLKEFPTTAVSNVKMLKVTFQILANIELTYFF